MVDFELLVASTGFIFPAEHHSQTFDAFHATVACSRQRKADERILCVVVTEVSLEGVKVVLLQESLKCNSALG